MGNGDREPAAARTPERGVDSTIEDKTGLLTHVAVRGRNVPVFEIKRRTFQGLPSDVQFKVRVANAIHAYSRLSVRLERVLQSLIPGFKNIDWESRLRDGRDVRLDDAVMKEVEEIYPSSQEIIFSALEDLQDVRVLITQRPTNIADEDWTEESILAITNDLRSTIEKVEALVRSRALVTITTPPAIPLKLSPQPVPDEGEGVPRAPWSISYEARTMQETEGGLGDVTNVPTGEATSELVRGSGQPTGQMPRFQNEPVGNFASQPSDDEEITRAEPVGSAEPVTAEKQSRARGARVRELAARGSALVREKANKFGEYVERQGAEARAQRDAYWNERVTERRERKFNAGKELMDRNPHFEAALRMKGWKDKEIRAFTSALGVRRLYAESSILKEVEGGIIWGMNKTERQILKDGLKVIRGVTKEVVREIEGREKMSDGEKAALDEAVQNNMLNPDDARDYAAMRAGWFGGVRFTPFRHMLHRRVARILSPVWDRERKATLTRRSADLREERNATVATPVHGDKVARREIDSPVPLVFDSDDLRSLDIEVARGNILESDAHALKAIVARNGTLAADNIDEKELITRLEGFVTRIRDRHRLLGS